MSFFNVKNLFVLSILTVCIFCSCSKSTLLSKDKNLQIAKFTKNMHNEKIKEFKDFNIESIVFFLYVGQVVYKKEVWRKQFDKLKYAVTVQSRPFTDNKARQNVFVECKAYGRLVFHSEKKKMTIDICDDMFFWDEKRQVKHAFVSKELTRLVIEEMKEIKSQGDYIDSIIEGLQESIKPKGLKNKK